MSSAPFAESELVARAQSGETDSFEQLVRAHLGAVHGVALARLRDREAAEDLVQEVFLRAFVRLESLRERENFAAWLMRIARNQASTWKRDGQRASRLLPQISVDELAAELPDRDALLPSERLAAAEERQGLREAVWRLPEEVREVILLHYAEGMTKSEIARRMDLHPSSVARQLDRALALLRSDLESELRASVQPLRAPAELTRRTLAAIAAVGLLSPEARDALAEPTPDPGPLEAASPLSDPAASSSSVRVFQTPNTGGQGMMSLKMAALGVLMVTAAAVGLRELNRSSSRGSAAAVPVPGSVADTGSAEKRLSSRVAGHDGSPRPRRSSPAPGRSGSGPGMAAGTGTGGANTSTPAVEMGSVEIRILNEQNEPVGDAVIEADGVRPKERRSSHYGWLPGGRYGPPPVVKTDGRGLATMPYPKYIEEKVETGAVSFKVRHPDYVEERTTSYSVDGATTGVVLKRGATLLLSAWREDPANRVAEFDAVGPGEWSLVNGDRKLNSALPPGPNLIYLWSPDFNGSSWQSDPVRIDLKSGERRELHVELKPLLTVEGRLSNDVPRPVRNGEVVAVTIVPRYGTTMHGEKKAAIREDGTFELKSLSRGTAEIIAICDGWVSSPPRADETTGVQRTNQQFLLDEQTTSVELRMRPSATVQAQVTGPDGEPIAGAMLTCNPNVYWGNGLSQIYIDHTRWRYMSGVDGEVTVSNLPPGRHYFRAWTEEFEMPIRAHRPGNTSRDLPLTLESGETTQVVLQLVPKGSSVMSSGGEGGAGGAPR